MNKNYKTNPDADQRIHFFSSAEESELYTIRQREKQEPLVRLRNTVNLIIKTYGLSREQLAARKPSDIISIKLYS